MGPVKKRLDALWLREARPPFAPLVSPNQNSSRMYVKVRAPLRIPAVVLPPGIYVLRPHGAGAECTIAQILNKDQTELIATFGNELDH